MTADVIALCRREPDADAILAALHAAAPGLRVRPIEHAGMIQVCGEVGGEVGRALVTIEGPLFVRVPGEADRILGPGTGAPHPAWWVEARAPGGGPADGPADGPGGREIARGFADALIAATGGCTWPSR